LGYNFITYKASDGTVIETCATQPTMANAAVDASCYEALGRRFEIWVR
jgi:hypothetical protein